MRVVLAVAEYLRQHPDATLEQTAQAAKAIAEKTQMCFIPKNLDYLRAGGRVSNSVALVGNLLNLHPSIEIIEGKLIACKKYRGGLNKVVPRLLRDYDAKHNLKKDHIFFIHSPYLPDDIKALAEATAKELGFQKITWVKTGCVITCHGGPGAFGIVGVANS